MCTCAWHGCVAMTSSVDLHSHNLLGCWKAALYRFYFHRKCPEHPEQCQYICIYVNNMADAKSAIFR